MSDVSFTLTDLEGMIAKTLRWARRMPFGTIDIYQHHGDEWREGFMAGQVNALETLDAEIRGCAGDFARMGLGKQGKS